MSRQIDCGLLRSHHPSLTYKQIQCQLQNTLLPFQLPSADYSQPHSYCFNNLTNSIHIGLYLPLCFLHEPNHFLQIFPFVRTTNKKSTPSGGKKKASECCDSDPSLFGNTKTTFVHDDSIFFDLHLPSSCTVPSFLSVQRIPISLRTNLSFSPRIFSFLSILSVPH
jgi:hypothetical protein